MQRMHLFSYVEWKHTSQMFRTVVDDRTSEPHM